MQALENMQCGLNWEVDTLAKRLKWVRNQRKLTQTQLAELASVQQSDVSKIERGDTLKPTSLLALARATQANPDWLDTGDGPWELLTNQSQNQSQWSNVEPIKGRGGVPLISWVQAGSFCDVADPFQPGEAEQWLPCPVKHGPRAFCLVVRGESMFNPEGKPSYSEGDVIFVDPDLDVMPGDRAIFRLEDDHQVTFKQLIEEDGRRLLKALNPAWNPRYIEVSARATICGKVIGKWSPE